MCIESPIYQKAFVRYLRYGHTPDAQMKSVQETNGELLREKVQGITTLASQLVDDRISKLELLFAEAGRDWPDIPAPDTETLENDFKVVYREMLGNFSEASGAMLPEDFSRRFTCSENFLVSRYGQKLDATIQPHYGVEYFIWYGGGGENSCGNCIAHSGQTFTWGDGGPPGCDNCQCSAVPAFDKPDENRNLDILIGVLLLLPWTRVAAVLGGAARVVSLARLREKLPAPKPVNTPSAPPAPKPSLTERPANVPKDWKQAPTKDGEGVIFTHPTNKGTYVKVEKGNPNASQPGQRYDNVRVQKDGASYDANGNVVPRKSEESHIPLKDFKLDEGFFK